MYLLRGVPSCDDTLRRELPIGRLVSPRFTRLPALFVAGAAGLAARALYDRLGRFEISEASIAPALQSGDYVVTDRSRRPVYRGNIVVFEHPDRPSFYLVKRIIGLPGERLSITSGRVLINDHPLDEPWTTEETGPDAEWKLGPDEALVLGDARSSSTGDSRTIGAVRVEHLTMRIVFRYWPLERFGPIR